MDGGMLWRNGCDGKVLRCGAGNRHQHALLASAGVHHDTLRVVSTSMSMAGGGASDGGFQPGLACSVKTFMEGERRQRPVRRNATGSHGDVALLCQEAWLYGPDSAIALGHQKEKIILLLRHSRQAQRPIKTVQDAGRV